MLMIMVAEYVQNIITTYAGYYSYSGSSYSGDGGAATSARLNVGIGGIVLSSSGSLYIADTFNSVIRLVSPSGIITTYAGTGGASGYSGDGGPATSSRLNSPSCVALSSSGSLYIADTLNSLIRLVSTTGIIMSYAGTGIAGYSGDGGPATLAKLNSPYGVAVASSGSLYIADRLNNVIRLVSPTGIITTYAGSFLQGYSGDGGAATNAKLNSPIGVALSSSGSLCIADTANMVIRLVSTTGIITTIAGYNQGTYAGYGGDGGPATSALLNAPKGVAVSSSGSLYIADTGNNVIRLVSPTGIITAYAGSGQGSGYDGDGGAATGARLSSPGGVALSSSGSLYIADSYNMVIRVVSSSCAAGYYNSCAGGSFATGCCSLCPVGTYNAIATILGLAACLACTTASVSGATVCTDASQLVSLLHLYEFVVLEY